MGKFSRDKGKRNELLLVHYLRSIHFNAVRVPLSGACAGYESDVVATRDNVSYSFELKARKDLFKSIYETVFEPVVRFSNYADNGRPLIAIGTDLDQVNDRNYPVYDTIIPKSKESKVYKRLVTLHKWKGKADFLVLKDDRKPFLFVRYWW